MDKLNNIEEAFLNALGSNEQLKWYLEKNIDIFQYLRQTHSTTLFVASALSAFISKKRREEISRNFNLKRILSLIKLHRPDLYPTFSKYPNSEFWLEREIKNFKKRFL